MRSELLCLQAKRSSWRTHQESWRWLAVDEWFQVTGWLTLGPTYIATLCEDGSINILPKSKYDIS